MVWSVNGGDDAASFVITDGGNLYFKQPPDFEDPLDQDEDNIYSVTVVATEEATDEQLKGDAGSVRNRYRRGGAGDPHHLPRQGLV